MKNCWLVPRMRHTIIRYNIFGCQFRWFAWPVKGITINTAKPLPHKMNIGWPIQCACFFSIVKFWRKFILNVTSQKNNLSWLETLFRNNFISSWIEIIEKWLRLREPTKCNVSVLNYAFCSLQRSRRQLAKTAASPRGVNGKQTTANCCNTVTDVRNASESLEKFSSFCSISRWMTFHDTSHVIFFSYVRWKAEKLWLTVRKPLENFSQLGEKLWNVYRFDFEYSTRISTDCTHFIIESNPKRIIEANVSHLLCSDEH